MASREHIVRYSAEELRAMIARGEDRTDWARVNAKTEEDLAADSADDPDWAGIDEAWLASAVVVTDALVRPRENKTQVTMRFDADILTFFKQDGRGWQGRMNAVLRSYMIRSARRDPVG